MQEIKKIILWTYQPEWMYKIEKTGLYNRMKPDHCTVFKI